MIMLCSLRAEKQWASKCNCRSELILAGDVDVHTSIFCLTRYGTSLNYWAKLYFYSIQNVNTTVAGDGFGAMKIFCNTFCDQNKNLLQWGLNIERTINKTWLSTWVKLMNVVLQVCVIVHKNCSTYIYYMFLMIILVCSFFGL